MQRRRMTMPDQFLPLRRRVDDIQRQRHLNQFRFCACHDNSYVLATIIHTSSRLAAALINEEHFFQES